MRLCSSNNWDLFEYHKMQLNEKFSFCQQTAMTKWKTDPCMETEEREKRTERERERKWMEEWEEEMKNVN